MCQQQTPPWFTNSSSHFPSLCIFTWTEAKSQTRNRCAGPLKRTSNEDITQWKRQSILSILDPWEINQWINKKNADLFHRTTAFSSYNYNCCEFQRNKSRPASLLNHRMNSFDWDGDFVVAGCFCRYLWVTQSGRSLWLHFYMAVKIRNRQEMHQNKWRSIKFSIKNSFKWSREQSGLKQV